MPSCSRRESKVLPPWTVMRTDRSPLLPPTSWELGGSTTAGINAAMPSTLFAVGTVSSTSRETVRCCVALGHVHQRRRAADRDGLLERADLELGVDLSGEVGPQLETITLEGGESRERERHGVQARPQFGQPVLAAIVSDGRANFLDEGRAGGLDGYARQHRARRVADDAGDSGRAGALRQRGRRDQAENGDEASATTETCQDHWFLLV